MPSKGEDKASRQKKTRPNGTEEFYARIRENGREAMAEYERGETVTWDQFKQERADATAPEREG